MHRWIVNRWIVYRELAQPIFLVKAPKFLIVMHKNNGARKVFPETAIPKLPKTLSKVGIF